MAVQRSVKTHLSFFLFKKACHGKHLSFLPMQDLQNDFYLLTNNSQKIQYFTEITFHVEFKGYTIVF